MSTTTQDTREWANLAEKAAPPPAPSTGPSVESGDYDRKESSPPSAPSTPAEEGDR
jgi:hypothetical protein